MDLSMQAVHSSPIKPAHIAVSVKREQQSDKTQAQPNVGFVDMDNNEVEPLDLRQVAKQDVDPLTLPGTCESQSLPEPHHFQQEVLDSIKQEPPETLVCPTTSSESQNTDQDVDSPQLPSLPESWCEKQEEFNVKDEPPILQDGLLEASQVCSAELQTNTDNDPLTLPGTSQSLPEPHHFQQEVLDSIKQEPPEALVCPTTSSEPQNTDQDVDSMLLPSPPESWCLKQEEFHVKDEPPILQGGLLEASQVCSAELQTDTGLLASSTKCSTSLNFSAENHSRTECDAMFTSPDHVKKRIIANNIWNQGDEQTVSGRHQPVCSEEKVYVCDTCEARFSTSSALNIHKRTHSGERPFACDLCEARFTVRSNLNVHKRTHSGVRPYPCDVCEARFTTSDHLTTHKRTHSGEKPYACDLCEARFTVSYNLTAHKRIHSGVKPYACDICGARFTTSSSFTTHKRTHSGIKPYACDICEAKFTTSSHLRSHKRVHSGEKPYHCDVCEARFTNSHNLTKHKRTHTGEKPYSCDVCEARFTVSDHLTAHKRTHSGVKPYACDVCEARFTYSSHLTTHKRTHSGIKPFACDLCEARFTVNSNLRSHKRTHSGEKPYGCDVCEAKFTQSSCLTRHKRTHSSVKP